MPWPRCGFGILEPNRGDDLAAVTEAAARWGFHTPALNISIAADPDRCDDHHCSATGAGWQAHWDDDLGNRCSGVRSPTDQR